MSTPKTNFDEAGDAAAQYAQWEQRLAKEIPFVTTVLREFAVQTVCDAGCAEGQHSVALARAGFTVTGVEPRDQALAAAQALAKAAGVTASFARGTFQTLGNTPGAPFDAVLVLGNSLSLVGDWTDLDVAIRGIEAALKPGGVFLSQTTNYLQFDEPKNRWRPVRQTTDAAGRVELLVKHFAPWGDGYFVTEFLHLRQQADGQFTQELKHARLLALTATRLAARLESAFEVLRLHGHVDGRPWAPAAPDLIVVARKRA